MLRRAQELEHFHPAKLSYRSKICLVAAGASAAPWLLCFIFLPSGTSSLLPVVAAALVSAAFLLTLRHLLLPLATAAERLVEHIGPDPLPRGGPPGRADEMDIILQGISGLSEQVGSLQHRWIQRHSVTGLPTREALLLQIRQDLLPASSPLLLGTIRFVDYDRLTAFDADTAERGLKSFASRLAASVGKDRPLAHVDRDCFAIWFRATDPESAATELRSICYALGAEIVVGDTRIMPELELGAATYPTDGDEPSTLMTRALVAMRKMGAPEAPDLHSARTGKRAKERFSLEQDLRRAVSREQLELHFQPVVDLAKGQLVGAEALLRWRHPEAGMIAPDRFIPILEDSSLMDEIGRWTLNAACREARGWERRGMKGLKVAVNLSARQLRDAGLKQAIRRTLDRHRLRPQALELELTETAATEDAERTFFLFSELRALGISLAIDDFGSGYSSLSYLKNLPFDKLKIDREFVVNVHERSDSQAICRSLIELTRGLGINILAEGVESPEEIELLRRFGCDIFQGFYFSRPLAGDEFVRRALDPAWRAFLKSPLRPPHPQVNDRTTA